MNIDGEYLFNQQALQGYIILCCQQGQGGLKDKPTKYPDIYHTCYSLSGFSCSSNKENYQGLYAPDHTIDHATYTGEVKHQEQVFIDDEDDEELKAQESTTNDERDHQILLCGLINNAMPRINPIYNARFDKVDKARKYF